MYIVKLHYYFNVVVVLVIKKRKKELHLNGGEIVLDQEGLVEVIKLHQRKGVQ